MTTPATGRLVVNTSYHPTAIAFSFTSPRVEVDGHPYTVPWGMSWFDLPAGNHLVRVSASHRGDYGVAQLVVAVAPGQTTTVFYRPPASRFMYGSLGFTPQPSRGMVFAVAIWVVLFSLVVATVYILGNV